MIIAVAVGLATNVASANTTSTDTTTPEGAETATSETTAVEGSETTTSTENTENTETTEGPDTTETTEGTETTDPAAPSTETTEDPAQPATDEEREQLKAAELAKAREVDAANARLGVLTDALAVLQKNVESQAAEVEIATRQLAMAEATLVAVNEDVAELEATVVELEEGLSDQAIRSFKGELIESAVIEIGSNPNQAIRMQAMLAKATESDIDYVNELAGAREVLLGRRADVERAALLAEESRLASEEELLVLEEDQLAQLRLTGAAEDRLDHLLSERATLARIGADYNESGDEAALVAQLSQAPAAPRPPSTSTSTTSASTVTESDIRLAGNGIEVHVDIVDDIRQLLADAAAAGVELAGGGYRDSAGQIRARMANCGTSNFAIYEMRSSQCSPPTARPGRSMHEQGKAIDFTYNGQLIRSRSGAGWNWLNANAVKYGLFNLPSEPWHWSTTGR